MPIQFYWEDNDAETTLVTFQGNVSSKFAHTPVFAAHTVTEGLRSNRLLLSDPSLKTGRDVTLGWYAGSAKQPNLQVTLTNIIMSLVPAGRVVLFGAGAGGFAALEQSTRIAGSTVVAMNPHTDVLGYRRSALRTYLSRCWSIADGTPAPSEAPMNHSVVDAFARPVSTQVVYLQNQGDAYHADHHMRPFLQALHPHNRVLTLETDLPGGHVIPGKPSQRRLLETVLSTGDWKQLSADVQNVPLVV